MDLWQFFAAWMARWEAATALEHASSFGMGALGGTMAVFAKSSTIVLPKRTKAGFECGAAAVVMVGAIAGFAADYNPVVSLLAGAIAPLVLPELVKTWLPALAQILAEGLRARLAGPSARAEERDD